MSTQRMRLLSTDGTTEVTVAAGSQDARLIGSHLNAVKQFLHTGDAGRLAPYGGIRVHGQLLATDPDWIERWAARGELDFEDIYESAG